MLGRTFALSALVVMSLAAPVRADLITDLFNTGFSAGGTELVNGDIDPHWFVAYSAGGVGPDTFVATNPGSAPGAWLADSTTSTWITPAPNANGPNSDDGSERFVYTTTFSTPGGATHIDLIAQVASDNQITNVLVDGVALNTFSTDAGFSAFTLLSLSVDVDGSLSSHTLGFEVVNGVGEAPALSGFTGFRGEFSSAQFTPTAVPEPGTVALLGLAGVGLMVQVYRRRRGGRQESAPLAS